MQECGHQSCYVCPWPRLCDDPCRVVKVPLRRWTVLGLLLVLALVVFAFDLSATPETLLPAAVYAVPIIVAAWALPPGMVAAVAVWSGILQLVAGRIHSPPIWLFAVYMFGISFFGILGTALSAKISRERTLARLAGDSARVAGQRAAELQSVLENMIDAVFVCDLQGRITLTNEGGVRLLGLSSRAEVERGLGELIERLRIRHPDGRSVIPSELPLARALQGEAVTLEDELVYNSRLQRDIYLRSNASPLRDDRGRIVGAVQVARDVTELTELDRLKDQFITVAAHELKTPVTIMKGYAQALLRGDEGIPPERRKMLESVDHGANRIDGVVNDLLDISRLHQGQLELTKGKIDLAQLVGQVVERMAPTAAKHQLRVASAEPLVVEGDRDRLEQVVATLIDNAIRYSPSGGRIEIKVERGDHEAVLSVRDHGVGIPADRQARIFQRFYRAHTGTPYDYGGMGVGLYISREIVFRHGGRMWFESEEGKGSTFQFTLPLA